MDMVECVFEKGLIAVMKNSRLSKAPRLLCGGVLLLTAVLLVARANAATDVWIDTDPSIGAPWREVDDAFALVLAFHSPELRIVGISTTYGNARLSRTTTVARDLVRRCGGDVKVYQGASSPRDVEKETEAVEALARALRAQRLTYLALGPLTNLAAFLRKHPELAGRLERVIFVGGKSPGYEPTFGRNGWLRIHDANVFKDPAAAAEVLRTRVPLVLAPVETSSRLVVTRKDWRLLRTGAAPARFLHARTRVWIAFWVDLLRHPGGPLFDSLAVLAAAQPEHVRTEARDASMQGSDLIVSEKHRRASHPVRFATRVTERGQQLAIERLRRRAAQSVTPRVLPP